MKINPILDQDLIHEFFDYKEGKLFWRTRDNVPPWWNTRYAGKHAGSTTKNGFRYIQINQGRFFEHRLVWGYFFGDAPKGYQVGHKDNDGLNNNIDNLALYEEHSLVFLKGHKPRKTAKLKIRGVYQVRDKYRVEFQYKGKRYYCGYWDTEEEAETAYLNKKKQIIERENPPPLQSSLP